MKIVITDAKTLTDGDISLDFFKTYGDVDIYQMTLAQELDERIADADMVICNKTEITAETMKKAKKLKYIGLFATGFNNIDIAFAKKSNIVVCNAPAYSTEAVAQHTFSLIFHFTNRISEYNSLVSNGDWINSETFSYFPLPLTEINNKTIGLIGYGSIGKRVAEIAKAFKMNVLVFNRSKINDNTVSQVDFDTLLKNSDIVSLHCPLNEQSKEIMNKQAFSKMKKGSIFINTARGPIVNENDLKDALECGQLGGAGVDVLTTEPMSKNCPLYNVKNCVITPHIAWAALETRERLLKIVEENIKSFLSGNPQNVVNK